MDDETENDSPPADLSLAKMVGVRALRKLRAKRHSDRSAWWGLGMIGTIGWSVAIPTLLGVFLGRWLDRDNPGGRSWTLALLAAGLVIGCMNAWHWVGKKNRSNWDVEEDGK